MRWPSRRLYLLGGKNRRVNLMTITETDPCAPTDNNYLTVDEGRKRVLDAMAAVPETETLPLSQCLGRINADSICSDIDVPGFANAAMDGYGIRFQDWLADPKCHFDLIGKAYAGHPFDGVLQQNQAIRITTGAKVPESVDAVVMQEHCTVSDTGIHIDQALTLHQNIRFAGEDIRRHDVVIPAGQQLNAADLGMLASLGQAEVKVKRKLRVAFFTSGDEIQPPGEPLGEGQIYDSNRYTLLGLLQACNCDIIDLGLIRDSKQAIRDSFGNASKQADVLLTTGGVSVGDADYIKEILQEKGQVEFWRLAMKPGKPLAFGRLGDCWFFGLPGNPVSAMVTFLVFALPGIRQMQGLQLQHWPQRLYLQCTTSLKKSAGREEFQRGFISESEGKWTVSSTGPQGSHILNSMSKANCFIRLAADIGNVAEGEFVEVWPFVPELLR